MNQAFSSVSKGRFVGAVVCLSALLGLWSCATSKQESAQSQNPSQQQGGSQNQSQDGAALDQGQSDSQVATNSGDQGGGSSEPSSSGGENLGDFPDAGTGADNGLGNSVGINNAPTDPGEGFQTNGQNPLTDGNVNALGQVAQQANGSLDLTNPSASGESEIPNSTSLGAPASGQTATGNAENQVVNSPQPGPLGYPHGVLNWVGYDYKKNDKKLDVQIVTDGTPSYKIFKETNRANQSEIIVRYMNTKLRSKIRRDIDASEFRSPVAYIRMRYDRTFNHTDVVMTMRDAVEPTMVTKGSSLMFSFDIPERWYAPAGEAQPVAAAEVVEDAPQGLTAVTDQTSEETSEAAAYVDNPGADKFKNVDPKSAKKLVPKSEGDKELVPQNDAGSEGDEIDSGDQMMMNFKRLEYEETRYALNSVAQADFSSEAPETSSNGADLIEDVPVDLTAGEALPEAGGSAASPGQPPAASEKSADNGDLVGVDSGAGAGGSKKVMRLDFRDAPVNQIIKMIAAESNINFIISPEAGEKRTSISLKNVPWDVALKAVLDSNGLGMQELSTGLVRIDFLKKFAEDHDQAEKARLATEALVPTKVLVMPLNYLKASDAATMIREMLPKPDPSNVVQQRSVSRFRVQAETRSNSIIVEATPNFLSTAKNLLERLDTQTPQVRIQSRLVEFEKTFDDGLGVTWGAPLNIDAGRGLGFGSLPFPNSINSQFSVDPGGAKIPGGSIAMKLGSVNNFLALDIKLRAYETRKLAETLQTQDVVVQDNEEASMSAGSEDSFLTAAGVGSSGALQTVRYLLSLKVKPHITADGSVQMKLDITGDTPGGASGSDTAAAKKSTRALSTTLLKRSGETAVIGGLYESYVSRSEVGVPILSKIPLVGALFRSLDKSNRKKDVLIMVTPTILGANSASTGGAGGASTVPTIDGSSFGASNTESNQMGVPASQNGQSSQSSNATSQSNEL